MPFVTIRRLELVWFMGMVMLALTSFVESTGNEKLPLLAVMVLLLVPS